MTPEQFMDGIVYANEDALEAFRRGLSSREWCRYWVDEELKLQVERIDPRMVYFDQWRAVGNDRFMRYEPMPDSWNPHDDRRFTVIGEFNRHQLRQMACAPGEPHLWDTPWVKLHLTPVAAAVKIALDDSVN